MSQHVKGISNICFQFVLSFRVVRSMVNKISDTNFPLALLVILLMKTRSSHMPYRVGIWFTIVPFYKVCSCSRDPSECAWRIQLSTNPGVPHVPTVNKNECCAVNVVVQWVATWWYESIGVLPWSAIAWEVTLKDTSKPHCHQFARLVTDPRNRVWECCIHEFYGSG